MYRFRERLLKSFFGKGRIIYPYYRTGHGLRRIADLRDILNASDEKDSCIPHGLFLHG